MEGLSYESCLPDDVLREILVRLPVKTLLQFKCVCRHWYALIERPNFVNQHFHHQSNQEQLLVRHYRCDKEKYAYALYPDETLSGYEEPEHLQLPVTVEALMGPLNGIFYVVSVSGLMALINPATRQVKPVPLVNSVVQPHLSSYDEMLGFGLDPLTGSYKIVSIQVFWDKKTNPPYFLSFVSVYNSRGDCWRHFEDVDILNKGRCAYRSLCNTYLNGVYYWLTDYIDTDVAIIAFDMSCEKFQEIHVPDCIITSKEGDLTLYGDSIALISCDLDKIDKCFDVWVMQKEGCWTKSLSVGPFHDIKWPIGFWGNDELLLEAGDSLLTLYNVGTKKLRTVETRRKENGFFIYWVFCYKESLVSLNGERNRCMQMQSDAYAFVKDFFK